MSGWGSRFNAAFVDGLRALDVPTRARVLGYVRTIMADPVAVRFRMLPPMFTPGTRDAVFAEFTIRFFVTHHDEESGEVQFIRFFRD